MMEARRLVAYALAALFASVCWSAPARAEDEPAAKAGDEKAGDEKAADAAPDDLRKTVEPPAPPTPPARVQSTSGWLCCPPGKACCGSWCPPRALLKWPCVDDCIETFRKNTRAIVDLKTLAPASCLQVEFGGYHWWNADFEADRITYGYKHPDGLVPVEIPGTYFFYLKGTLECPSKGCTKYGAHLHARFREDGPIRPFIADTAWFQEAYVYARNDNWGIIKLGKVTQQFGQIWNESFWGNTEYYNGFKINPEWGVSAELQKKYGKRLVVPLYLQGFVGEDGITFSMPVGGGDAESTPVYDKEWTAVARIEPRYYFELSDNPMYGISQRPHWRTGTDVYATYASLGLSALVGGLSNTSGPDETQTAFAIDAAFETCGWRVYAEYAVLNGTVNPVHYVTLGPCDKKAMLDVGVRYRRGPFQARVSYSRGDYDDPVTGSGDEAFWLFGLDVHLLGINTYPSLYVPHYFLSTVILTFEYVTWKANYPVSTGLGRLTYENGLQILLNWNI